MKLSYLVTCHNEKESLDKLLSILIDNKDPSHEIVVLDDYSDDDETISILNKYKEEIQFHQRHLNNHYGEQKNYGIDQCKGEFIFQLDGDEYPTDGLIQNIEAILNENLDTEVFWLPRINIFRGITENDVLQWGWKIIKLPTFTNTKEFDKSSDEYKFLKSQKFIINESDNSVEYYYPIINMPDYQSRIFKNEPYIRYKRRLHEKVEGFKSFLHVPPNEHIAIIHDKEIEKQRRTNIMYNQKFSQDENRGYKV